MLAAERGIPHDPSQHAADVANWIKALKNDKNEISRAGADASRATDYLLKKEKGEEVEQPAKEIKASEEPFGEYVQRYRATQRHSRYR
jgi:antirestriction protein ArdC